MAKNKKHPTREDRMVEAIATAAGIMKPVHDPIANNLHLANAAIMLGAHDVATALVNRVRAELGIPAQQGFNAPS